MKDYRVEVKVKNNLLYRAMINAGYSNAAELAKAADLYNSSVCDALSLKKSVFKKNGRVTKVYDKLSRTLRVLPEDLAPSQHHYNGLEKNTGATEISEDYIQQFLTPTPDDVLLENEKKKVVNDSLNYMNNREQQMTKMLYGLDGYNEHKLCEVADKFKITSTAVARIIEKGLKKLRHPYVLEKLNQFNDIW